MNDDEDSLNASELGLLDWLARDPRGRILQDPHDFQRNFLAGVPGDPASPIERISDEDRIEIAKSVSNPNMKVSRLLRLGFVGEANLSAFAPRVSLNDYRTNHFVVTRKGLEFWRSKGRDLHDANVAKRKEAEDQVSRWVVIGAPITILPKLPLGFKIPGEKVFVANYLARVTRETDKRVYVDSVKKLNHPGEVDYHDRPVSGTAPNQYVERRSIMLDNANAEKARILNASDIAHVESLLAIQESYVAEMKEAAARMEARLAQKRAEREDALREIASPDEPAGPKNL